jgi:hypothetical protein
MKSYMLQVKVVPGAASQFRICVDERVTGIMQVMLDTPDGFKTIGVWESRDQLMAHLEPLLMLEDSK